MKEITLAITGMSCASWAQQVEQALRSVSSVRGTHVAYPRGIAKIESDSALAIESLNAALPNYYRVETLRAEYVPGKTTAPALCLAKIWESSGNRAAFVRAP